MAVCFCQRQRHEASRKIIKPKQQIWKAMILLYRHFWHGESEESILGTAWKEPKNHMEGRGFLVLFLLCWQKKGFLWNFCKQTGLHLKAATSGHHSFILDEIIPETLDSVRIAVKEVKFLPIHVCTITQTFIYFTLYWNCYILTLIYFNL